MKKPIGFLGEKTRTPRPEDKKRGAGYGGMRAQARSGTRRREETNQRERSGKDEMR